MPAVTAQGSAARSLRCRARAMNRRAEGGTASVSARTSRQLRVPPPLTRAYRPFAPAPSSASSSLPKGP
jgi:hypothetical protein